MSTKVSLRDLKSNSGRYYHINAEISYFDINNIIRYSASRQKELKREDELADLLFRIIHDETKKDMKDMKKRNKEISDGLLGELSFQMVKEGEKVIFSDEEDDEEDDDEEEKRREEEKLSNNSSKKTVYYYKRPVSKNYGLGWIEEEHYIFSPGWVTVVKASKMELGEGVLGVAYPGLKLVKVLGTLEGNDYQEVLKHELNHIFFPHENEQNIRYMTKRELPFYTRYH